MEDQEEDFLKHLAAKLKRVLLSLVTLITVSVLYLWHVW